MSSVIKTVILCILLFNVFHLIRDVAQIIGIQSLVTQFAHIPHMWCQPGCDYVTFPLILISMSMSAYVLYRNYLGKMGRIVIALQLFWPIFTLLP